MHKIEGAHLQCLKITIEGHVHSSFALILMWEEGCGCFTLFVFQASRDCCVALPQDATGLSAVCDCGIS